MKEKMLRNYKINTIYISGIKFQQMLISCKSSELTIKGSKAFASFELKNTVPEVFFTITNIIIVISHPI